MIHSLRTLRLLALGLAAALGLSSCMTTYDAHGRPVQSVDPGMAAAGAVAAGVLGYAVAQDRNRGRSHARHHHHHAHHSHHHYRPQPPRGHYRRY